MEIKAESEVIVIGAGIAGLYTAYLLINEGIKVSVLEASPTYGGRIKSLTGFAKVPIELGAEFLHGKNSLLYELATYFEEEIIHIKGKNYVWWQDKLQPEFEVAENKEVAQAFDFMENVWKYQDEEMSVDDYLKTQEYYTSTQNILEVFGMEYGTSNEKLGIKSLATTDAMWHAGKSHYKLKVPMLNLLREFKESIGSHLYFNEAVEMIDYSQPEKIIIKTANSNNYQARKVVCTIPLSMLKQKNIEFTPELPSQKLQAIETLGIDSGIKVFLKFKERFWHKKMWELYGTSFCPLYYQLFPDDTQEENILVAYIMGKFAETFRKKDNLAIEQLVLELDLVFGDKQASKNLSDSFIMDWKKEKYIQGTYSFDSIGSIGMKKTLATSIENRVFFGGEATNYTGHSATLHGAMEPSERCYEEIKNTLYPTT